MERYGNIEKEVVLDKLKKVIEENKLHIQSAYWYGQGLCFFLRKANKNNSGFIKIYLEDLCRKESDDVIWQFDINQPMLKIVSVKKMPKGVKLRVW